MNTKILEPDQDIQALRKSSISQNRNKFSVMQRGEWTPIEFDVLDAITCDGVISHRAILTDDTEDMGYQFPVATQRYTEETLVAADESRIVEKELPAWFGGGTYQEAIDQVSFLTSDNGALGSRNTVELKIGLDYVVATKRLKADD